MPAKAPKLSIYADDDLKRDLKILADHEQRSVSHIPVNASALQEKRLEQIKTQLGLDKD
jgi:predicted transcriptional regulator